MPKLVFIDLVQRGERPLRINVEAIDCVESVRGVWSHLTLRGRQETIVVTMAYDDVIAAMDTALKETD